MSDVKETSITVEVVYRGIFQKTLAQRICRSIVLAARKRGHTGTAFARYGDSPERNGVPAKQFAVVAINDLELEASMATTANCLAGTPFRSGESPYRANAVPVCPRLRAASTIERQIRCASVFWKMPRYTTSTVMEVSF